MFDNLIIQYKSHAIFSDVDKNNINKIIYSCYPLHPVSTFILPRLSEKIAQNERTLFTFLSSNGLFTLTSFLNSYNDDMFDLITPDIIFDYFEPLLKKEIYSESIYKIYILTSSILNKIDEVSLLERKIIKTISLMYILENFEKLKPTKDEVINIFLVSYSRKEIELAIDNLIEKDYVVYLKRSNKYLQLKQSSGINIKQQIQDKVVLQTSKNLVKDTLNKINFDKYMYPSRYNDDKEMTRFFSFEFINSNEVTDDIDWNIKSELISADGIIYAIVFNDNDDVKEIEKKVIKSSKNAQQCIFILLKKFNDISSVVKEFNAVSILKDSAISDRVLFEEYDIIYEDLKEILINYILEYTHPERLTAKYIYLGSEQKISRKAALTELLSNICDKLFFKTPVINNESINKNEITSIANNSRHKIISALLHNELDENLGLTGNGQEVSIMRSILLRTNVLIKEDNVVKINMCPKDDNMASLLKVISDFILSAKTNGKISFDNLYEQLTSYKMHIGLRKGVIPIFLSAVIHEYKQYLIITNKNGQVNISADTLLQINAKPEDFYLQYIDWNKDKEMFIKVLSKAFSSFVMKEEVNNNSYDYLVSAIKRWYVNLPKYSREIQILPTGEKINKQYSSFIKMLKYNVGSYELLFEKLPLILSSDNKIDEKLADKVIYLKNYYDNLLEELKDELIYITKQKFVSKDKEKYLKQLSLTSVIKDWCQTLNPKIFEQLFKNGAERGLRLFKEITNNEKLFIDELAKVATDLRLEDWDYKTIVRFKEQLDIYKITAEEYSSVDTVESESNNMDINSYQITFVDDKGNNITKRFERMEYGSLGRLLYNSIMGEIDSMGQSISEQEKRQILIEVLKEFC
ncbi:MAG: restriction endonuclease subunit S [Firmicutes bacterium]|nr:restriction endonuclease subunit S [Candidatus Alectryobacillus merdavium]